MARVRTKTIDRGDGYTSKWQLTSNGLPVSGATPTFTISLPDGSTQNVAVVESPAGTYNATFTPSQLGRYVLRWQLATPQVLTDYERLLVVAPHAFA